jgi:DNA-binding CsgD family transcriptional regulator
LYRKELFIIVMLVIVVLGSGADLLHDWREGADLGHLAIETVLILASFLLIGVLTVSVLRQQRDIRGLKRELGRREDDRAQRPPAELREARHRLAELAERQFREWSLTHTEQEVALLLLKGLSFKEIAAVRDTVEKTVRQQASSVYRKSGLGGRHELAAWFIEDFL